MLQTIYTYATFKKEYLTQENDMVCTICTWIDQHLDENNPGLLLGLELVKEIKSVSQDPILLSAALIYPTFRSEQISSETCKEHFGTTLYKLVSGTQSLEFLDNLSLKTNPKELGHIDKLRKFLLAIIDDFRILFLKLAERITYLKHLKNETSPQKNIHAQQVMSLYAPLANRLGIGQMKWKLEDLAFRILNPEEYKKISQGLKIRREQREFFVDTIKNELNALLKKADLQQYHVSGRAKHIYSIYRKTQRKQIDVSEIYDTTALRVLVPTIEDCYMVLSLVHTQWQPIQKEFDDYIAHPKPNGYQSIHTAIIGPNQHIAEIQIRTFSMHESSEKGFAAHWKYKEGIQPSDTYETRINLLRDLLEWQRESPQDTEQPTFLLSHLFEDRIYVFTPQGDVIDLPTKATPLDFAYHIHSDIGHRCRGAKINGKMVSLSHLLQTGDRIEILTQKEGSPSRDWLNPELGYLYSAIAKQKVRHWFKRQFLEEAAAHGRDVWDKGTKSLSLAKNTLELLTKSLHLDSEEQLFATLGRGEITVAALLKRLEAPEHPPASPPKSAAEAPTREKNIRSSIQVEGTSNLLTQLALCCHPLPGDPIWGYITQNRGITIHQKQCPNIQVALKKRPERITRVSWGNGNHQQTYPVKLLLQGNDREGLVRDITNLITTQKIPLLRLDSRANPMTQTAITRLTIELDTLEHLEKLIKEFQKIPGIMNVVREG